MVNCVRVAIEKARLAKQTAQATFQIRLVLSASYSRLFLFTLWVWGLDDFAASIFQPVVINKRQCQLL